VIFRVILVYVARVQTPTATMTFASVRDAAQEAVKAGKLLPHQLASLIRLDERLEDHPDILREFTKGWRLPAAQVAAPFTPGSPFTHRVTPNITYGELALQHEARRFVKQHQCDTALELCTFAEKARMAFGGRPVIITSAFRPPAINAAVGGASRSEHLYDAPGVGAIDFYLEGVQVAELQEWADKAWPYSLGYGAPRFVHIGKRRGAPRVRWDY
jgi:hypothetical protein